jgi:hypothetical protein
LRTLAVDCDPNPNLAESFGLDSAELERWTFDGLRPAPGTLELAAEPPLVEVEPQRLWLLGGPPGPSPLNDAVARGIAGVLVAGRFDWVVTDLGAGPEFAQMAVGGALNPAALCLVLSDGGTGRRADGRADRGGVPPPRRVARARAGEEVHEHRLAGRLTRRGADR